jgi:mannose/fructose-specific phosphotransferase system component IIA
MSEAIRGVVVAHADLAAALVAAVRAITGDDGGLVAVSNAGTDRAALARLVEGAAGPAPAPVLVFTDLAGGSCTAVAATVARGRDGMRVVSGVNLGMLLDFAFHREEPLADAAARAAAAGRDAVREIGR